MSDDSIRVARRFENMTVAEAVGDDNARAITTDHDDENDETTLAEFASDD